MKAFLDEEFLLQNEPARRLYHGWAEKMPIVDYHCHIDPRDIAEDRRFDNITQVWLGGDHYKWRLIRSNGVPEEEITGNVPDRVKFQRFAEALPRAIGNPLYHWTHLELKRYFGYDGVLTADTAETVWNLCNEKLADPSFSAKNLITRSNVAFVGTTDDPADSLGFHGQIRDSGFSVRVSPSWRPDRAVKIEKPDFADYIRQLGTAAGVTIDRFDRLLEALENRLDFFEKMGCCASDHGLEGIPCREAGPEELEQIFQKALRGESVTPEEKEAYQFAVLRFLGKEYARRGWVMQLHFSCMRNPNSRMLAALGQLCSALYWRLNKFWTILISVAVPLVLIFGSAPLLTWLDTTSAGRAAVEALAAFGRFLAASPWNAAAVLLAMGAAFFALSWLLLRRAMIRPAK